MRASGSASSRHLARVDERAHRRAASDQQDHAGGCRPRPVGDGHGLDGGAALAQRLDGGLAGGLDGGRAAAPLLRHPADAQVRERAAVLLGPNELRLGLRQRALVGVVVARDDVEHDAAIVERARDRPDLVHRPRQRHGAVAAHAAVGRAQARHAAEVRRAEDRAPRLGADARTARARAHARARARRRAAGPALAVPRVRIGALERRVAVVVAEAAGQLGHGELRAQHRARVGELLDHGRVVAGTRSAYGAAPHVVVMPFVSSRSFAPYGMPCSGPRSSRAPSRGSAFLACAPRQVARDRRVGVELAAEGVGALEVGLGQSTGESARVRSFSDSSRTVAKRTSSATAPTGGASAARGSWAGSSAGSTAKARSLSSCSCGSCTGAPGRCAPPATAAPHGAPRSSARAPRPRPATPPAASTAAVATTAAACSSRCRRRARVPEAARRRRRRRRCGRTLDGRYAA